MEPIQKSGYYETTQGERFLLVQQTLGSTLFSGKDCLLWYFPDPACYCQVDSISLRISNPKQPNQLLIYPKREILRDETPGLNPQVGIRIKAFLLSKSGDYAFDLFCLDEAGNGLSTATIPAFSFTHDIDLWMNGWIPNGLAI
jgi:hypothetical protein